ncbi:MAG: hypothetical protein ABJA35_11700 [Parafilimonas sp.]
MPDQFNIPVMYNNEEKSYLVTLIRVSYSYQLHIEIDDQSLVFEPDDIGQFRMIRMQWQNESDLKKIEARLIQTLIETLNKIYC